MAHSFSRSYGFGLSSLGLCEAAGVEPESKYAGRTKSTDHCCNCKSHSASGNRWTVGATNAQLQMTLTVKCSASNMFSVCM
jgi:hypothetical protein